MDRNIINIAADRRHRLVLSISAGVAVRLLLIADEMLCASTGASGLEGNDSLVDKSPGKVGVVREAFPVAAGLCHSTEGADLVLSVESMGKTKSNIPQDLKRY